MSEEKTITKFCISCNQEGHHYNECKEVPFYSLLAATIGLPDIYGDRAEIIRKFADAPESTVKNSQQTT